MTIIDKLRSKFAQEEYEFSKHAVDQTVLREISIQEIQDAMSIGEVIEDYPDDKYGPSCLVLGFTKQDRPVHIQCSYPSQSVIKVITVYEPDPDRWADFKKRR